MVTKVSRLACVPFFALLALLGVGKNDAPTGKPPAATLPDLKQLTPFAREVMCDFDQWDVNHDGVLSATEIDARVADPLVTGMPAAALGAIKEAWRSGKYELPPLTRNYLILYSTQAWDLSNALHAARQETIPFPVVSGEISAYLSVLDYPYFDGVFYNGWRKIHRATSTIFTDANTPRLDKIHQGQTGDCYLLSVLGAMLDRDGQNVRGMIAARPNGTCLVRFPSGRTVMVPSLTDTEIAMASDSEGTGRWLAVLETAYAQMRNNTLKAGQQNQIATDIMAHGGSPRLVIRWLTGHNARWLSLRPKTASAIAPQAAVSPLLPLLRATLVRARETKHLCAASTPKFGQCPPAITVHHVFSVLGYDTVRDRVRLWNPHGNTFAPQGTPGLANGYPTHAGTFEMPLVEFAQTFDALTYETAEAYTPPPPKPTTAGTTPTIVSQ